MSPTDLAELLIALHGIEDRLDAIFVVMFVSAVAYFVRQLTRPT